MIAVIAVFRARPDEDLGSEALMRQPRDAAWARPGKWAVLESNQQPWA